MALIKQIKAQEKSKLTIAVSKKLNDDFKLWKNTFKPSAKYCA